MTKFILHGGETSRECSNNQNFFRQFSRSTDKLEVNILLCYWARDPKFRQQAIDRDIRQITGLADKTVNFDITEGLSDFESKMASADVLYVAGGSADLIEPQFLQMNNLGELLDNKVYIGSSMGAFLVSQSYVLSFDESDKQIVREGHGLIPFSILCHWDVEKLPEYKLGLLKQYNSQLPILCLDEANYIDVFN